jgi:hypothetical protein
MKQLSCSSPCASTEMFVMKWLFVSATVWMLYAGCSPSLECSVLHSGSVSSIVSAQ